MTGAGLAQLYNCRDMLRSHPVPRQPLPHDACFAHELIVRESTIGVHEPSCSGRREANANRNALQPIPSDALESASIHAKPLRTLLPVFFYFVAAGIATVMLGPLLPALIHRWHIQDAQAGALFTANFTGQFCGAWFATRNLRASIICGSAITAVGCIAMAWAGFGPAHLALFGVGLGLGAGLTAGNVIAGTTVPTQRARLIAILNVVWGLGAIACPVLVRLLSPGGMQHFFFATSAFLAVTSLAAIIIPNPNPIPAQPVQFRTTSPSPSRTPTPQRFPLPPVPLLAFGAASFLYIGIENALGGWLPSYAVRTNPTLHASSIALCFWIAELTGRILITVLMTLISEAALCRLFLALLILTQVLLCLTPNISAACIVALTSLGALSIAPLYPLIMSFLLARTGNHANLGALFAAASFGGASLPWLTGVFSTQFHNLRTGFLVPAAGAALLLVLSPILTANGAPSPNDKTRTV
jgi:MFS transporter, FHS family, glucose/mannose:H+ symporter